MILLIAFFLFILATAVCLALLIMYAVKAKQTIPLDSSLRREKSHYQKLHIHWVKWFYLMTTVSVALIVMVVQENNGRWGPAWLRETHMVLTKVMMPLLVLPVIFNGRNQRRLHTLCVYLLLIVFSPTLITGISLFFLHPLLLG